MLKFNELLEAEDSDRQDAVNFEFVGVDKKVFVGEVFADCAELKFTAAATLWS